MEKREFEALHREVFPVLASLGKGARGKIERWSLRDEGLTDTGELEALLKEYREIRKIHNEMVREACETFKDNPVTAEQKECYREKIAATIKALRDLNRRLDESEEMFLKYNVPRLRNFGSLEAYVKALRAFMRVWREEANEGRERGEKSLIDWLQQLNQSDDEGHKTTLEDMRLAAVDIGYYISRELCSYFTLMLISAESREELEAKLQEVETVLLCLGVDENSAIIERFLASVKFARKALKGFQSLCDKGASGEVDVKNKDVVSRRESMASDLLHLIFREVLRLEVTFCCPDLPMMLVTEVFLSMIYHLRAVFNKKLNKVSFQVKALEAELQQLLSEQDPERFKIATQVLEEGLKMIWDNVKLKPVAKPN